MQKFKRILLKLSGESLAGASKQGIDTQPLMHYANQIVEISELGIEIAVVIGGGNIFRGFKGEKAGFDRVKGDYMGMLATMINGLALLSALEDLGAQAEVLTAFYAEPVGERYSKNRAVNALKQGKIVILTGGTGNPFFTTDTGSALRAIEINADIILKGTRVDGVYSDDPEKNPDAIKYTSISFDEIYEKDLNVMDMTAFTMCRENNMPVYIFNMDVPGNLLKVIQGENIGTMVHN